MPGFNQFGGSYGFDVLGQSYGFENNQGGIVFDPDAQNYFDSISDPLTLAQKIAFNNLVIGLKADISLTGTTSNWDEIDVLWIFFNISRQAAYLNLKLPAANIITDGVQPSFAQFSGLTGNGTTQYINLNYNPSTQGIKYQQDNSSAFAYCKTNPAGGTQMTFGGFNASNRGMLLRLRTATDIMQGAINGQNVNIGGAGSTTDSIGLTAIKRTLFSEFNINRNGSDIFTLASISVAIANISWYGLARNNNGVADNFDNRLYSLMGAGSGMIDFAKLKTRIDTFESEVVL